MHVHVLILMMFLKSDFATEITFPSKVSCEAAAASLRDAWSAKVGWRDGYGLVAICVDAEAS